MRSPQSDRGASIRSPIPTCRDGAERKILPGCERLSLRHCAVSRRSSIRTRRTNSRKTIVVKTARNGPQGFRVPVAKLGGASLVSTTTEQNRRGWIIVGAIFVTMFFIWGAINAGVVFFVPIIKHFGWSRAKLSVAFSIGWVTGGASGPLIGWLADRVHPKKMMMVGAVVSGLGWLVLSRATNFGEFLALNGLFGVCVGASTVIPCSIVIASWFTARRGLAMGIAFGGGTLGGALMTIVANYAIAAGGWRFGYLTLGLPILVVSLSLIVTTAGTLLGGPFADRWGARSAMIATYVLAALGMVGLLTASHPLGLAISILAGGFAAGALAVQMPLMIIESLGMKRFGSVFGITSIFFTAGAAVSPGVTGRVFDQTGSYSVAIASFAVMFMVCSLAVSACRTLEREQIRFAPEPRDVAA